LIELELQQPCLLVYRSVVCRMSCVRVFRIAPQQDGDAVDFNVDVGRGGIAVPAALEERPVEVAHAPHILVSVFLGDLIGDDRQEALLRDAQREIGARVAQREQIAIARVHIEPLH
jgi:hypothetical protein